MYPHCRTMRMTAITFSAATWSCQCRQWKDNVSVVAAHVYCVFSLLFILPYYSYSFVFSVAQVILNAEWSFAGNAWWIAKWSKCMATTITSCLARRRPKEAKGGRWRCLWHRQNVLVFPRPKCPYYFEFKGKDTYMPDRCPLDSTFRQWFRWLKSFSNILCNLFVAFVTFACPECPVIWGDVCRKCLPQELRSWH